MMTSLLHYQEIPSYIPPGFLPMYGNCGSYIAYRPYDMWTGVIPFPSLHKVVEPNLHNNIIETPTEVQKPNVEIQKSNTESQKLNTDAQKRMELRKSTKEFTKNITESQKRCDHLQKKMAEPIVKLKEQTPLIRKALDLGPSYFPHSCVCGHQLIIRDAFEKLPRYQTSVTIRPKTKPIPVRLRKRE